MIVDNLKSCYTTTMRLRTNPPLTATVRWYWAPPGAKPLPTPTAFASMVWETDWFHGDVGDLGETSLTRTWDSGATPPGVTGQSTPTPLSWYLTGVPAGVTGPLVPCAGKLPAGPLVWLRPEELPYSIGASINTWKPAPGTTIPGTVQQISSTMAPLVGIDPTTGKAGARLWQAGPVPYFPLHANVYFGFNPGKPSIPDKGVQLPGDYTMYVVGRTGTEACSGGALLTGDRANAFRAYLSSHGQYSDPANVKQYPETLDQGGLHRWSVQRAGSLVTTFRDGQQLGQWSGLYSGQLGLLEADSDVVCSTGDSFLLFELIVWPRALGVNELAVVDAYLAKKYAPINPFDGSDMLIGGAVLDFGGDVVPPLWLQANGQAVSRSTYTLLFQRYGVMYGAGDGSTTFNVPDCTKGTFYGAGGVYQLPNSYGNDSPSLTVNQLPAHTHPISDTGHFHAPNIPGTSFCLTDGTASLQTAGVGSRDTTAISGTTGTSTTGVIVGSTGSGQALDVRQKGIAVRVLIYAGVAGGT